MIRVQSEVRRCVEGRIRRNGWRKTERNVIRVCARREHEAHAFKAFLNLTANIRMVERA
ncbi:MAG: hypothetical protein ACREAA_04910 [Candidatus Polarisedimenticolia bacterium]